MHRLRRLPQNARFSAAFLRPTPTLRGTWIAKSEIAPEASINGGGTMHTGRLVPMAVFSVIITAMASPSGILAAPSQVQDTSRHLYDRVMEEFKHRDYEAALAGFRLFLELHGQTSLAANAQYWVGECQYRMGRYKEALKAFYNVVSYYPLSPKLAASTLKIGQTYTKLKDQEKARMMFERVVDQYPDSPEAEVARKALDIEAEKVEAEKPSEPPPMPTE
jgi:tol-pal system protein YbgF